jgi:hypothetical protein
VVADPRQFTRGLQSAEKSASKFGRDIESSFRGAIAGSLAFRGFGRSIAFASATFLGGAGLVAATKSAIQAASDLNEETSKTNVVFGASAQQVKSWAQTTTTAMGLSERQALATASSFGALLRPLGIAGQTAADQSQKLTQLGADLASFYNTNVQDALDAIKSGLVGEVEPLRRYGVLLSETRVQQEALAETGKTHASALTNQEKVLARINLIYRDSAQAQGDFERTSGGLANQQRILAANVDQLQTNLGQALLPAVLEITKSLNDWLGKSENQEKVTRDVEKAVGLLTGGFKAAKIVLDQLDQITGSFTNTLKVLFGVFVAFKTLDLAAWIERNIAGIGVAAEGATVKVRVLRATLLALRNPIALIGIATVAAAEYIAHGVEQAQKTMIAAQAHIDAAGSGVETTLVPRLAKQIDAMRKAGKSYGDIINELRVQLGSEPGTEGTDIANDLIAKAFEFRAGTDPALTKRIRDAAKKTVDDAKDTIAKTVSGSVRIGPSVEQRNTWFNQMIQRSLGRVQDIPTVTGQIQVLQQIAAKIQQRINATTDITRKLNLEDQRLEVLRTIGQDRQQLQQDAVAALQLNVARAQLTQPLDDDIAAWQTVIAKLEQQNQLYGTTTDRLQQILSAQATVQGLQQQVADQRKQAADALKQKQEAANQAMLDSVSLGVDRAQLTSSLDDDIAAQLAVNRAIRRIIRTQGDTIDLERQLIQGQVQVKNLRQQQADARKAAADAAAEAAKQAREEARQRAQEAAQAAAQAAQARAQAAQQARDAAKSAADASLALAQLTDTTADDVAALEQLRALTLRQARATGGIQQNVNQVAKTFVQIGAAPGADWVKQLQQKQKDLYDASRKAGKAVGDGLKDASPEVRLAVKQIDQQIRDALQFRELGLGPTGEQLPPRLGALQRRFAQLRGRLTEAGLDTPKIRQAFAKVGRTLADGVKNGMDQPVRSAINTMLDGWADLLKNRQTRVRFQHLSATAFADVFGAGLTGGQRRRLELGLAMAGPGLTMPPGRSAAFHPAAAGPTIHIEHFHSSARNAAQLEEELVKRAKGRPHVRRGAG